MTESRCLKCGCAVPGIPGAGRSPGRPPFFGGVRGGAGRRTGARTVQERPSGPSMRAAPTCMFPVIAGRVKVWPRLETGLSGGRIRVIAGTGYRLPHGLLRVPGITGSAGVIRALWAGILADLTELRTFCRAGRGGSQSGWIAVGRRYSRPCTVAAIDVRMPSEGGPGIPGAEADRRRASTAGSGFVSMHHHPTQRRARVSSPSPLSGDSSFSFSVLFDMQRG